MCGLLFGRVISAVSCGVARAGGLWAGWAEKKINEGRSGHIEMERDPPKRNEQMHHIDSDVLQGLRFPHPAHMIRGRRGLKMAVILLGSLHLNDPTHHVLKSLFRAALWQRNIDIVPPPPPSTVT